MGNRRLCERLRNMRNNFMKCHCEPQRSNPVAGELCDGIASSSLELLLAMTLLWYYLKINKHVYGTI